MANFAEGLESASEVGQDIAAQILPWLQRKYLEREKPNWRLDFGYFDQAK